MVGEETMVSLGIMQGRLSPSNGRGIQFFPFDAWEKEFVLGKKIGINEIEWIFDYENYQDNPLWREEGIQTVKSVIAQTGVKIRSVCFDYFMRRPFFKFDKSISNEIRKENIEFVRRILISMKEIGAELLEIPMVDDSSIKTVDEEQMMVSFLREVLVMAKPLHIMIGCETDLPVGKFRNFLESIGDDDLFANYDSGNSSGLGYDHEAEILSLAEYIANVHIKDREFHGTTRSLGTGSADFEKVFSALYRIGYKKSILLQAARGADGDEEANIRGQLDFVKAYCEKYRIGV